MILIGVGRVSTKMSLVDQHVGQDIGQCSDRVSGDLSVDVSTDTLLADLHVVTNTVG